MLTLLGEERAGLRAVSMQAPLHLNQRWSLDFLSDTIGACRKFRILTANDDCCRENLGLIAEAQDFTTQWLWTYNNGRPKMGIGGIIPAQKLKMAA